MGEITRAYIISTLLDAIEEKIPSAAGSDRPPLIPASSIPPSLARMLGAVGGLQSLSRIRVCQEVAGALENRFQAVFEWTAPDIAPHGSLTGSGEIPIRDSLFRRLGDGLESHPRRGWRPEELPEAERALLEKWGVRSLLATQVTVRSHPWGFVAFEDCRTPRSWDEPGQEALQAAVDLVSEAVMHESLGKYYRMLVQAVDASPLGVVITDAERRIVFANRAEARMHGYGLKELLGQPAGCLGPPGSRREASLADFRDWERESVNVRRDGGEFPVRLISTLLRDRQGRPAYCTTVCQDLSERRLIEQTLQGSEKKFRAILEGSNDAILLMNDTGCFDCNAHALKMFGFPDRAEIMGARLADLSPRLQPSGLESGPELRRCLAEVRAEGHLHFEWWLQKRSGDTFPADVVLTTLPLDGRTVIRAGIHDISDKVAVQRRLRKSEQKYRTLVDHLEIGIFQVRHDHFVHTNAAMVRIFGYESGTELYQVLASSLFADFNSNLDFPRELKRQGLIRSQKMQLRRKDGSPIWALVSAGVLVDDNPGAPYPAEYNGFVDDISEKTILENIALAMETVKDINVAFSGIRHEIGNPVNSIKTSLTVLRRNFALFPDEKKIEYIDRILADIQRIEFLLQALRSFNMQETVVCTPTDLVDYLKTFLRLIRDDLKEKQIALSESLPPGRLVADIDPRAFHQVLMNLTNNAVEAVAGRPAPAIHFALSAQNRQLRISIVDNGCGISEEKRKYLFQPFFTSKPKGTGMGMIMCKKLLAQMGGMVELNNNPEAGVSADILLPQQND